MDLFSLKERLDSMSSDKERIITLLDHIPEYKLAYVLAYVEGAAIPDETPNDGTLEAFHEMSNGKGHVFSGTTNELFDELMED